MIPIRAAGSLFWLFILNGCASHGVMRVQLPVPADQAPKGYASGECHYESPNPDAGGFSSMSAATDAGSHQSRRIVCEHDTVTRQMQSKCVGIDGQEKPMELCKPQN